MTVRHPSIATNSFSSQHTYCCFIQYVQKLTLNFICGGGWQLNESVNRLQVSIITLLTSEKQLMGAKRVCRYSRYTATGIMLPHKHISINRNCVSGAIGSFIGVTLSFPDDSPSQHNPGSNHSCQK